MCGGWFACIAGCYASPSKKDKVNTAMRVEKLAPHANGGLTLSMWRMICMYCRMLYSPSKKDNVNTAMRVEKLAPHANGGLTLSMWRMICMYCRMLCAVSRKKQVATQSKLAAWSCALYTSTKSPAHMDSKPGLCTKAAGCTSGTVTCSIKHGVSHNEEKKRKQKTTNAFGVNSMRSQVLYRAAQSLTMSK